MRSADLLSTFAGATLALTVAVALAFLLSRVLRPRFGAGVAYAAWWLVPASLFARLLPAPVAEMPVVVVPATMPVAAATMTTAPTVPFDPTLWLAALWLLGALAMALRLWWLQRRFERGLGALRPLHDDLWQAQASHGLPALLGVMRARIVLPDDFQRRYDTRERQLMLAHERTHRRRGDHLANFAVAALRCAFWFNPLVHLAARFFRHDQELACDQAVIAAHPDSRRAYGEAMLKTLMADRQAPLGCHWGFSHPLKERVMQLKSPMPRPWARRIGAITVALLALGTGFAVWSAQPVQPAQPLQPAATSAAAASAASVQKYDLYSIVFDIKTDDQPPTRIDAGGPFGSPLEIKYRDGRSNEVFIGGQVRRQGADRFDVALVLKRNGKSVGEPRLLLARDKPGTVRVGKEGADGRFDGIELSMRVDDRGTPPHLLKMLNALPATAAALPTPPSPLAAAAPPAPPSPQSRVAPPAPPAPPSPTSSFAPPAPQAPQSPPDPPAPLESAERARAAEARAAEAAAIATSEEPAAARQAARAQARALHAASEARRAQAAAHAAEARAAEAVALAAARAAPAPEARGK